ncbi:MAG TPA: hypothetical protein VJU80_04350 [Solirubrobacteraceae bacterium]|nr:hypothetical protein [Solirubrobacteraceae bacterium]
MTDGAVASIEARLAELSARVDGLAAEREALAAERDEYRKLYLQTLETCRKLELGLVGAKRECRGPGYVSKHAAAKLTMTGAAKATIPGAAKLST